MKKETMTPKERWLAVLQHKKPDRLPLDYNATTEADALLMKYMRCPDTESMLKKLHIDVCVVVGPKYVGPSTPDGTDIYGCRYRNVNYVGGSYAECTYHPLADYKSVDEIKKNYKWPDPDWWDYSDIPKQIIGKEDNIVRGGHSEPMLFYKYLRGDIQAFVDLIENPEIAHYCLDKLFELSYENTIRIYEAIPGVVKLTFVAEDLGGQEDLLYSPEHIREFLLPGMKKMMDLTHQNGAYVMHHSDGAIRKILPAMIEAGIDILNPVQWRCKGMDREGLKRDFGDKIVFHSGVDNQHTLPFGTKDEVIKEVLDNIRILGRNGGYILAPCHNIQSNTPPENVVAMYETAYENGWQ